jgi:hypothetical protein
LLLASACTRLPRPKSLEDSERLAESPSLEQARRWAPQAVAHAEQLRDEAEAAHDDEKPDEAAALGDRAVAAYERAVALARLARAEQRAASAEQKLSSLQSERALLQKSQVDLAAQADALELQYKVARDAEPLEPIEKSSASREAARRRLAESVIEEARLLCVAARLLDPNAAAQTATREKSELETTPSQQLSAGGAGVQPAPASTGLAPTLDRPSAEQRLDGLEQRLASAPVPTPVNEAVLLRSECLTALTAARREKRLAAPASDPADQLLAELSEAFAGSAPFRDDRGVVISVSAPLNARSELTPAASELLQRLARVSRAHPEFPILLVQHGKSPRASEREQPSQALQRWLNDNAPSRASLRHAGDRLPATVAPVRGAKPSDSRLDFVFVAPQ